MSISNISILFLIMYLLSTIAFTLQFNHFLMALFCLEAMMLSSMLIIITLLFYSSIYIPSIPLVLLTLGACEASIGLSLMVSMSRYTGADYMSSMNLMKC